MNTMTGAQAASTILSAEEIIERELAVFRQLMLQRVSPAVEKKATALLSRLQDVFYFSGYINSASERASVLDGYSEIPLHKNKFDIEVGQNADAHTVNILDTFYKFIGLRQQKGLIQSPLFQDALDRWVEDLEIIQANDAVLLRRGYNDQAEMQMDWTYVASQPKMVEPAPSLDFKLSDGDIFDIDAWEKERAARSAEAAQEQERFLNALRKITEDTQDPEERARQERADLAAFQGQLVENLERAFQNDEPQADIIETPAIAALADYDPEDYVRGDEAESLQKIDEAVEELRDAAQPPLSLHEEPVNPRDIAAQKESQAVLSQIYPNPLANRAHSRWDPPALEHIEPKRGLWKSVTWSAVGAFTMTAAMTSASRIGLISAATFLGVGAMPAAIGAAIAVGAARAYAANHRDIMKEARKAESFGEKASIIFQGVRRTFTLPKLGLIVAGSFGGAYAGEWVANNHEWILDRAAAAVTASAEVARNLIAHLPAYLPEFNTSAGAPLVLADSTSQTVPFTEIKPIAVQTIAVNADGVPVDVAAAQFDARLGNGVTPTADEDVVSRMQAYGEDLMPRAKEFAESFRVSSHETAPVDAVVQKPVTVEPATSTMAFAEDNAVSPGVQVLESALAQPDAAQSVIDSAPVVTAAADTVASAAAVPTTTHVVERGDRNLWRIAQQTFGVKGAATRAAVEAIIAQNPDLLANPNKLSLGQELVIPTSLEGAPRADCQWSRRALTCTP